MKKVKDILSINPFTDMPIEPSQIPLLVDREKEINNLSMIIESASAGFRQNVAILGKDGMGKTSLINFIYGKVKMKPEILPIKIQITQESTFRDLIINTAKELLESIHLGLFSTILPLFQKNITLKDIKDQLDGFEISNKTEISAAILGLVNVIKQTDKTLKIIGDTAIFFPYFKKIVEQIPQKIKTVMLLIDEGEYIATEKSISLLQNMRLLFQTSPFMVVIAGSPILFDKIAKVEPSFGNLFPEQNRIILTPLDIDHIKKLIITRLDSVKKDFKGVILPFTDDSLKVLFEYSQGNPRYVIRIASLSILNAADSEQISSEDVKTAAKHILIVMGNERFERLEETDQKLLITIAKLKAPSATELARESKIDEVTVSRHLNKLKELGYINISRDGRKMIATLEDPVRTFVQSMLVE